jgi:hypothetical protein
MTWPAGVALGAMLLVVGCSDAPDPCMDRGRLRFDRGAWLAHHDPTGMLEDLALHHLPLGMPRQAVIDLLGSPDATSPACIGYDTRCGACCWFNVQFDEKGLLTGTLTTPY